MDYERRIDEETWRFIRTTGECYPDESEHLPILEQRRAYEDMARHFRAPYPPQVKRQDFDIADIKLREYTAGSPTRTVLYLHGGGFVLGSLDSHTDICAEICAQTGYRVIAVDYRLAPEHKHPTMFNDAQIALNWVSQTYKEDIVLAGDSAGANLCAALAHQSRPNMSNILGQVLIYAVLGQDTSLPSYQEHAQAPMLTSKDIKTFQNLRCDGVLPENDPSFAPLSDTDFSDLPPTVLITADCDPVRDDSQLYCQKIQTAGGKAHWINEPGLVHGYLRARHSVRRAQESFERITVAIEALGQDIWPY
ncbi:alpha/beta hydrolase [Epibacterium ulvae]|uniref:alpha/beta hydrolase n=1 Tax=Epibacterium ulvae TaxID=1156985 RepID=UPI0024907214|nr:alpha/beta hydrolase [Epibacterium ulvae]